MQTRTPSGGSGLRPLYVVREANGAGYRIYSGEQGNDGLEIVYPIGNADIDASRSNSTRTWYEADKPEGHFSGWLSKPGPGNDVVELTYSGFGRFTISYDYPSGTKDFTYWATYGNETNSQLIPTTGSAAYSGFAVGEGKAPSLGYAGDVHGTATLSLDFGNQRLTSTLNLLTDEASPRPFGTVDFYGFVVGHDLEGSAAGQPGGLQGNLYGYDFQEFGYAFDVNWPDTGSSAWGVAAGTKN